MGDKPKTHCYEGHPLVPENLRVNSYGFRQCRTCYNLAVNRRRAIPREALKEIASIVPSATVMVIMADGSEFRVVPLDQFWALQRIARNAINRKGGTPKGRRWPKAALAEAVRNLTVVERMLK